MLIDAGLYRYRINGLSLDYKDQVRRLYPNSCYPSGEWADYQIDVTCSSLLRRYLKPQTAINIEGQQPFNPIRPDKLLPSLEWAMNWCVAAFEHSRLLFHSGVVVKNQQAILFPARSGSGKSTLSTYLGLNGWQLFSDEMAIIELGSTRLQAVFRPTSLKNESISIIRELSPNATISQTATATHKGNIAHVRTNTRAQFDDYKPTMPSAVVFVNFDPNAEQLKIIELDKSVGMSHMLLNQFNYHIVGEAAFDTLVKLVNEVRFFDVVYRNMSDVDEFLTDFVEGRPLD